MAPFTNPTGPPALATASAYESGVKRGDSRGPADHGVTAIDTDRIAAFWIRITRDVRNAPARSPTGVGGLGHSYRGLPGGDWEVGTHSSASRTTVREVVPDDLGVDLSLRDRDPGTPTGDHLRTRRRVVDIGASSGNTVGGSVVTRRDEDRGADCCRIGQSSFKDGEGLRGVGALGSSPTDRDHGRHVRRVDGPPR